MAGRAPDHKFVAKVPHAVAGNKTLWLPIGEVSIWIDKAKREISGNLMLYSNPSQVVKLFEPKEWDKGKMVNDSEPSMPVDDPPF